MIIWGLNPVSEALRSRPESIRWIGLIRGTTGRLERIRSDARRAGVAIRTLDRAQIERFAKGEVHNGVVAEVSDASYAEFEDEIRREDLDFVVLLDGVEDPRNLGAILRVADAMGAGLVVIPKHESVGLTAAVVKASAGAAEWVPVAEVTNLARAIERIKEAGFWVYGAVADGESLGGIEFPPKVAIVLGSEGKGIRRNVLAHCDGKVAIPMKGKIESLNVATAAAIVAWEVARRGSK